MKVVFISLLIISVIFILAAIFVFHQSNKISISNDAVIQSIATLLAGSLALFGAYITVQKMQKQIDVSKKEASLSAYVSIEFLFEDYFSQVYEIDETLRRYREKYNKLKKGTNTNIDTKKLSDEDKQEVQDFFNTTVKRFKKLSPDIEYSNSLSRMMRRSLWKIKSHEELLFESFLNCDVNALTYNDYNNGLCFNISRFYRDIYEDLYNVGYQAEVLRREIEGMISATSYSDWEAGIIIKEDENGFLIEHTRYPRIIGTFKYKLDKTVLMPMESAHIEGLFTINPEKAILEFEYIDGLNDKYETKFIELILSDISNELILNHKIFTVKEKKTFKELLNRPYLFTFESRTYSLRNVQ